MEKYNYKIKMTLKMRMIIFFVSLLVLSCLSVGIPSYIIARRELDNKGEVILKNAVHMALKLIDAKHMHVMEGIMSLEDAQEAVKIHLMGKRRTDGTREISSKVDLGKSGYYIVYSQDGVELMHPTLEGVNVWNVTDKGKDTFYLVQDQIKKAQDGGGFTYYSWYLPNSSKVGMKITYSELDPHWGWVVIAGSYMEDYNSGANKITLIIIVSALIVVALGVAVSMAFILDLIKPLMEIVEGMRKTEKGSFETKLSICRSDEIGTLAKGFNSMVSAINHAYEELAASKEELSIKYVELEQNREHLRESEDKYRTLVENSQDMIYSLDKEIRFISVNKTFEEKSGFQREQLIGRGISFILDDPEALRKWSSLIDTVFEMGKPAYMTTKFFRADGAMGYYHVTLMPLFNNNEVVGITGTNHEVTELIKKEKKIHQLAYYDALSGLPNRIQFAEKVTEAIKEAKINESRLAILYIDLDDFKKVNDTMGHEAGDMLLKSLSKRLQGVLRDTDILSRMGGDEFSILVKNLENEEYIGVTADKIIKALEEPFIIRDMPHYLGTSVGIVLFPSHGDSYEELMKNADTAMYCAKSEGKNQYKIFDVYMKDAIDEKLDMEMHLRSAFRFEEMKIHYQPLIDGEDGTIRGFEALMRWNSNKFGSVSPARFIPILEETGLIVSFGEWVLEKACRQNADWQRKTGAKTVMSVNISAFQFKQKNFSKRVKDIVLESGLDPQYLELEITESILIHNINDIIQQLKELRSIGIKIALDDFGIEYSSLNYLRQLPINTVKIDKSFINDIEMENHMKSIIGAIVTLAHDMDLKVVAEGVETEDQKKYLLDKQCDYLQGYYFYRPLDCEAVDAILRANKMD